MKMISKTPEPPYYAAIFTSVRTYGDNGYKKAAEKMLKLAAEQPGFLGAESVRDQNGNGITVSYWESLEAIEKWKFHSEHRQAKEKGRKEWYSDFAVRVAKVEAARISERTGHITSDGVNEEEAP
ncbi:antibiotic biosynthesis monooxygenase [Bacillus swezeyi]|nr:antibiotic biosynthesis monooxygenase [Bacillus swezeyi]MEC1260418.1 antibiotic biosynthesis monooxygenase [Bacillus swezeyi]MED2929521.1 antibiotic biosynthesis monooxygenase [Bacillus swezeyi]MED2963452.1 antibiotic biosynthesis monooxygenase [Bacillus swezeyi]MED3073403.1 antibiotic biosynthesis monooxygenase [Bacillus swezeyi]MED3084130.1 antibiotic biosynthesis monooxygenase [Bacillus swezeyi]